RGWLLKISRQAGSCWRRYEAQDLRRNRTDAAGRDLIARKRRAPGTIGITAGRVVNYRRRGAQISVPEWHSRYSRQIRVPEDVTASLVVAEEEKLVLPDAAAEAAAELIVNAVWSCAGKNVLGLQIVVAMIFKNRAVKIVGS